MDLHHLQQFINHRETDPEGIRSEIAALIRQVQESKRRLRKLEDQLHEEQAENVRLKDLMANHPETSLPIYREYMKDMGWLFEGVNAQRDHFALVFIKLKESDEDDISSFVHRKALIFRMVMAWLDNLEKDRGHTLYQGERLEEFILYMPGAHDIHELSLFLRTKILPMAQNIPLEHNLSSDIRFSCHCGIALYPEHGESWAVLNDNMEFAAQTAVKYRRSMVFYNHEFGKERIRHATILRDLRKQKDSGFGDFELVYQPFVNRAGDVVGCESLVRWKHPELGYISPQTFIGVSERIGDIRVLGRWILYQSLVQRRHWVEKGFKDIYVSVNLSPVQFVEPDLVKEILNLLQANNMEGRCLKLEITEGAIMTDLKDSIRKIRMLQDEGIRIAIDDFGTGHSSLNSLMNLPINTLKIDKSFVDDVINNEKNQLIVKNIIVLARNLGMDILAEGVETREQKEYLFEEGVEYIQGYYYSRPVSGESFEAFISGGSAFPDL